MPGRIVLFAVLLALAPPTLAESDAEVDRYERMQVIGSAERAQSIAGSAHYIGRDELARFDHSDVNRVLRQVPGVYLVEEEGFGLRPSIGMRGSGTDRSARVTVLEDGVLAAPAPYSAPAAYFFPTMARMDALELRKGSASVRHGPYTTGGALNLISAPVPHAFAGGLRAYSGTFSTHHVHARAGDGGARIGWLVETVQQRSDGFKRLDNGGDTGFALQDYLVKLAWRPAGALDHDFEFKTGAVAHEADETYLGLTAGDFFSSPFSRYAASQLDNLDTRHRQYQLRHQLRHGAMDFTTAVYRRDFDRSWYKLQSVGGHGPGAVLQDPGGFADELAWLRGADSPDNAIVLRDNNRGYHSAGVQHVVGWSTNGAGVAHDIELGVRVHRDEEDRFQHEDAFRMQGGRLAQTGAGTPGSQDNRVGSARAVAIHAQDEIGIGDWLVTPGLRYERIRGTRRDFALDDPARARGPTRVRAATHEVWIPGIGTSLRVAPGTTLFAGVHRGFTPPAPGTTADAEDSVNYEFGFRHGNGALHGELVGFVNDYDNLVGTCTESTGGGCTVGEQFDGGRVAMHGAEGLLRYTMGSSAVRVPVTFAYTYTVAEFRSSFRSAFAEFGEVERGDALAYLPRHQWRLGVGVDANRWRANVAAAWVDEMRTVAGTGHPERAFRTDSHLVLDLAMAWELRSGLELFGRIDNVLGSEHIVAWRPAGARPGKPRSALVGARWAF